MARRIAGRRCLGRAFVSRGRVSLTNDLPGLTIRTIAISGSGYAIGGQAMTLLAGAEVMDATNGPTAIGCDLHLAGGVSFFSGGSDDGLTLSGAIDGVGPFVKIGPGRTTFAGSRANTYSGGTQVLNGDLRLTKSDGVNAVPGDVLVSATGVNYEYGHLTTLSNEQIPNTATIHVGAFATLGFGGIETLGPLVLEGGARIQTDTVFSGFIHAVGTAILAGDITILDGINDATFSGDIALDGIRTITTCHECTATSFYSLRESTPGSGLIVRGNDPWRGIQIYNGTYRGPTIIEGGLATISNPNTAVRLRSGTIAGDVGSLVAEGGIVNARSYLGGISTVGDLRLNAATTLRLSSGSETKIAAGGTLDFGDAFLDFAHESGATRVLGQSYVVGNNKGSARIRGAFRGYPEGTILFNRFRLSYTGGDGNDLTFTEIGRYFTSTQLSAYPGYAASGEEVELVARVSTERLPNFLVTTGTVTFRDGDTAVAAVPLRADGSASTKVKPSVGTHVYTATYDGAGDLAPSAKAMQTVRVTAPAPKITSIDPAIVDGGTKVTITIRGTDFLPGGTVFISSSGYLPTFVSSTEVRFEWPVPRYETDVDGQLTYSQPFELGSTESNRVNIRIRAAAPLPGTRLVFEQKAITGPVVPGGGAAWSSIAFRVRPSGTVSEHRSAVTPDTDNDGVARWEQTEDVPRYGLWLMTDMRDGRISAGVPDGSSPPAATFPTAMFLRDPEGRYSHVIAPLNEGWDVFWVRPGVGAWTFFGADGGSADLDGAQNGLWVFELSKMRGVIGSPAAPPAGLEPGDVFLGMGSFNGQWIGDSVDAHLHESDGPGTLRFADSNTFPISESTGVARVKVLRTGGTDGQISINYTTVDDTAKAGVHYAARAGTLTFGPGEILGTIEIPLIDDTVFSGATAFKVVLSQPAGTTIVGPGTRSVPINDNDPAPRLTADRITVTEGDEGVREVKFIVTVSGATRVPLETKWGYKLAPYGNTLEAGTLTFMPGGPTSQTITVPYEANRIPEEDRIYAVWVYDTKNGLPERIDSGITVIDDDFADLTILDATVSETLTSIRVSLVVNKGSHKPITVKYATANGSATAGSDFTATSGTATFDPTFSIFTVTIPIIADSDAEGDESFTLVLSDVKNAQLRRASATITIVDDESSSLPVINVPAVVVSEGGTAALFGFHLSYPSAREVRFRATTVAGSAAAGSDFIPVEKVIVIPGGTADAQLSVPIVADNQVESTETVSLVLSEVVGATVATPTISATIRDDDVASDPNRPRLSAADVEVTEGNAGTTAAQFTVRLSPPATTTLVIPYATADGAATAPADYTPVSGTLTFAPGETTKTITVFVNGDTDFESDEAFTLVFGDSSAACRVINDDEQRPKRRSVR